jgi:hypothetical protein
LQLIFWLAACTSEAPQAGPGLELPTAAHGTAIPDTGQFARIRVTDGGITIDGKSADRADLARIDPARRMLLEATPSTRWGAVRPALDALLCPLADVDIAVSEPGDGNVWVLHTWRVSPTAKDGASCPAAPWCPDPSACPGAKLAIDAKDQTTLDGILQATPEDLAYHLKKTVSKREALLIRVDDGFTWGRVVQTLEATWDAGITQDVLVTGAN